MSFTAKQAQNLAAQISSGDYQNTGKVVGEALRLHELHRNKVLEELRTDPAKRRVAPSSNRSVKDIVKSKVEAHQSK